MIIVRKEFRPQSHRCPTVAICPVGAISQNGFSAPVIDYEKCTGCGKCTKRCPVFSKETE